MKKLFYLIIVLFLTTPKGYAQCDEQVREAFGGISSISIYNTYQTIGAIADGYMKKVYKANTVEVLMAEQASIIQAVIDLLDKCQVSSEKGVSEADVLFIKELIACLKSLKDEAQGLSDFVTTKSKEAQLRYTNHRNKAWEQIKELLEIE